MIRSIAQKLLTPAFAATCFILPVWPAALPAVAFFALIVWILHSPLSEKWISIRENMKPILLISGLFWIYLISVIYSDDKHEAWLKIETSLSLILLPLVVLGSNPGDKNKLLDWFVKGCVASVIVCFGYATLCRIFPQWAIERGWSEWDYKWYFYWKDRLSPFLHATYLSMYLNAAIIILMFRKTLDGAKRTEMWLILLFALTVILLGSRAGWLALGIVIPIYLFRLIFTEGKQLQGALIISLFAIMSAGLYFGAQQVRLRVDSLLTVISHKQDNNPAIEKSTMRKLIWPAALECAVKNSPFGTGIGDAHQVLNDHFEEIGISEKLERKLNAHNQYLQSFIAAGIPGLAALMFPLLLSLNNSIRRKDWIWLGILLLTCFNFYFESMLQTQAGVMYYALLFTILWLPDKK